MVGRKKKTLFDGFAEPDFSKIVKTNKEFQSSYNAALSYAHYQLSALELKKETLKYLKSLNNHHPLISEVKSIHENRFITIGKYVYILNNKGEIPDDVASKLIVNIEKLINEEKSKISASTDKKEAPINENIKPVISIQDRLKEKAREVAGEIEGWIDDFCVDKKLEIKAVEDFVALFKARELKSVHMRHVMNAFDRRAIEIEEVIKGKDKDLVEGYSNFSRPELKKFDLFFKNLSKACSMLQDTAKAERIPRKKKPISQDKLVSKLKYKKEDTTLGIVSLNPVQIISSKEVWIYNTKTRKLAQYKAADERGLSVKGASLENFTADSKEKTLRKPVESLAEFKKASKVKLRTFLKDLGTVDTQCTGKLNEHCVILRIDK